MTNRNPQLYRIKYVLNMLLGNTVTIESIGDSFQKEGIIIGKRQIYRDLDELQRSFLRNGEHLLVKQSGRKKTWTLVKSEEAQRITEFDIYTFFLGKITNPACFHGREESFKNIYSLLRDNLSKSHPERYVDLNAYLSNTHFYEVKKGASYQEKLNELIWICTAPYKIIIKEYLGDAVSKNKFITTPFSFVPVNAIYHRGSFFLGGILDTFKNVPIILDVNQILKYDKDSFSTNKKPLLKVLKNELEKRFGITQNMDEKIYDVELEFSSITGLYVKEHQWLNKNLKNDSFIKLKNGNWLMKMKCGLNRELVGWIFQWMGNVKIINPTELKELYEQQLQKMIKLNNGGELQYSNIFQPK